MGSAGFSMVGQGTSRPPLPEGMMYDMFGQVVQDPAQQHRVQTQLPSGQILNAPAVQKVDYLPNPAPSVAAMLDDGGGGSRSSARATAAAPASSGDAEARRQAIMNSIPGILAAVDANNPTAATPDASGARAAAFARAKDLSGQLARASLMSLRETAASRGSNVAGGSNPSLAAGEASVVNRSAGQLGDVVREQAVQDSDAAQHTADLNFQGGLQDRQQKMQFAQSILQMLYGGAY